MTATKKITEVFADAIAQADADSQRENYINVRLDDDGSRLVLTTCIAGKPYAWITFDKAQLDELIAILDMERRKLP